jgi:hypothetical protein
MKNNFIVQENVLFLYFLRISSLRKTGKQNLDVAFPDYYSNFKKCSGEHMPPPGRPRFLLCSVGERSHFANNPQKKDTPKKLG